MGFFENPIPNNLRRAAALADLAIGLPLKIVDLSQFHLDIDGSSIRRSLNLDSKAFLILFVGEMDLAHHYRRVDNLIRAVKLIRDPLIHLLLVGCGANVPIYQKLVGQLGLEDQVHFLGRSEHRNLAEYHACADVFVLPSFIQEAFPLVVLEAMDCGCAVVVPKNGGAIEFVNDSETGIVVDTTNSQDCYLGLKKMVENDDLRKIIQL